MLGILVMLIFTATVLAAFVCYILIVIKMFQNDQATMGIVCLVLMPCGGIGALVTLIFGWMKATEWNMKNLMLAYTATFVVMPVVGILANMLGGVGGG